jgi:hypothetical protein
MKRLLLLFVIAAMPLSSCVAATFYSVKAVTGTSPTFDNSQRNCTLPAILTAVPTNTVRMIQTEWWQNNILLSSDTLTVLSGHTFTSQSPTIPGPGPVITNVYAFFGGVASCLATVTQTPIATTIPPAAPTISVVP